MLKTSLVSLLATTILAGVAHAGRRNHPMVESQP